MIEEWTTAGVHRSGEGSISLRSRGFDFQPQNSGQNTSSREPSSFIDIQTLDSSLLKKLSPHYSDWIVEDPERVRYRRAGPDLCFFVEFKKGDWVACGAFPRIVEIGLRAYAFRRRAEPQKPSTASYGRGVGIPPAFGPSRVVAAEAPLVATVQITSLDDGAVVGLYSDDYRHFKQGFSEEQIVAEERAEEVCQRVLGYASRDPIVNFNDFVRYRKGICYPGDRVRVPQGLTLLIEGSAGNTDRVELSWNGPTSGRTLVECPPSRPNEIFAWRAEIPQVQPGDYTLSARVDGQDHEIEVTLLDVIYDVAYLPGTGELLLLTPEESERLLAFARELEKPVQQLERAQSREAAEIKAKEGLSRELEGLVEGPGSEGITEIIFFRGSKWTFVSSDRVRSHFRRYRLDADIRHRRELLDSDHTTVSLQDLKSVDCGRLAEKIREDLRNKSEGEIKYDLARLDDLTLALRRWAVPLAEKGDWFTAGAEQQLLRFTAGAGITTEFNPKTRAISLNSEAKADFALLEGKVGCTVSMPGKDGYDVVVKMPKKGSGEIIDLPLGAFLIEVETALTGYAGAKAIACADLSFSMKKGRLMLGGLNSAEARQLKQKDKHFTPAKAEINAFAGVSAGCEATGSLKWDNPEKRSHPKAREFSLLASIGGEVSASFGGGVEGGFYLGYDDGRFRFRTKAGVVLGAGCGGEVAYTVDINNTLDLVQFVYHSLMQADFDYLDFIEDTAFKAVDLFVTRYLWMGEGLKRLAQEGHVASVRWWDNKRAEILGDHARQQEAKRLAERILADQGVLRFAPPETKGRLIRALCEASLMSREELQEAAIIAILNWTQSQREYREILEHMTLDGSTINYREGESCLNLILDGLEMYKLMWLQFKLAISDSIDERDKSKVPRRAIAQAPIQKRFFG